MELNRESTHFCYGTIVCVWTAEEVLAAQQGKGGNQTRKRWPGCEVGRGELAGKRGMSQAQVKASKGLGFLFGVKDKAVFDSCIQ